jgi:hypothetical protein
MPFDPIPAPGNPAPLILGAPTSFMISPAPQNILDKNPAIYSLEIPADKTDHIPLVHGAQYTIEVAGTSVLTSTSIHKHTGLIDDKSFVAAVPSVGHFGVDYHGDIRLPGGKYLLVIHAQNVGDIAKVTVTVKSKGGWLQEPDARPS